MEKDKDKLGSDETTRGMQHAFVNCRLRDINSLANMRQLREQTMELLRIDLWPPPNKVARYAQVLDKFVHMTARLQDARLTINFEAHRWFSTENKYDSYTQMYERALQGSKESGVVVLTGNKDNPALARVEADEAVSFPLVWSQSSAAPKPSSAPHAMPDQRAALTKASGPRAPALDAFRQRSLMGAMSFGQAIDIGGPGLKENTLLLAGNRHFDPRTKQVFAALDYGRRPHGAAIGYGYSFLELNARLKTNAIYFAGDTFFGTKAAGRATTAEHQLSFDLLAVLYLHAKKNPHTAAYLPQALRDSCINDATLQDVPPGTSAAAALLVEAHIFEPVRFAGGVDTVYLSRKSIEKDVGTYDAAQWATLVANCDKFAARNGCRRVLLDE
jgi:hypothetical protein